MPDVWMPGASRAQDFSRAFSGSLMTPRVSVIHSTEGPSWPGYVGGATAPTATISRGEIRQHFPVNRSARALENRAGGVETNTAGAVQVEMLGYCDRTTWAARGKAGTFWPDADASDLKMLAKWLRWLEDEWGVPMVDAAPRGWLAYPASYGTTNGQRMSGNEWYAARGIVGHQHVPENSHGDPGNFPIHLITNGTTNQEDDMPTPADLWNHKFNAFNKGKDYGMPAETAGQRLRRVGDRAGRALVVGRRNAAELEGVKAAVAEIGKKQGLSQPAIEKIIGDATARAFKDTSITLSVDTADDGSEA